MATNKYWNSDIYVIRTINKESGEVSLYVGSTTDFDTRKGDHKYAIYNENRKEYNRKLYAKIRYNSGDWNMEVYKHFRCENQKELKAEEERVRVTLDADLNMNVCSTGLNTDDYFQYAKEYYATNKEKLSEKQRIYNTNNKEKISEKGKVYYTENREEILEQRNKYYANNKEKLCQQQKVHYANNREKVAEKKKIYYAKNKKIISEKSKVRYINNKEKKKKEIF